jgi:hypothetical protein
VEDQEDCIIASYLMKCVLNKQNQVNGGENWMRLPMVACLDLYNRFRT